MDRSTVEGPNKNSLNYSQNLKSLDVIIRLKLLLVSWMHLMIQRKRKALIVMATGTGKTRLSISIVDMLLRGQLGQTDICFWQTVSHWSVRPNVSSTIIYLMYQ